MEDAFYSFPQTLLKIRLLGLAAIDLLWQILRDELKSKTITVGCDMPGLVDTPLLESIAMAEAKEFPTAQTILDLKRAKQYLSPSAVANRLVELLTKTSIWYGVF